MGGMLASVAGNVKTKAHANGCAFLWRFRRLEKPSKVGNGGWQNQFLIMLCYP
jgi:hypothetical protein